MSNGVVHTYTDDEDGGLVAVKLRHSPSPDTTAPFSTDPVREGVDARHRVGERLPASIPLCQPRKGTAESVPGFTQRGLVTSRSAQWPGPVRFDALSGYPARGSAAGTRPPGRERADSVPDALRRILAVNATGAVRSVRSASGHRYRAVASERRVEDCAFRRQRGSVMGGAKVRHQASALGA
jgi:hypothetical protein